MGVSVREKPKASGYWWLFIRHKGQRVCQYVAQDKEIAEDAAQDIRKEIRTGKFDLAAIKAARAPEVPVEEKAPVLTLKDYFGKTVRPSWEGSLSRNTYLSYDGFFRVHILPALGDCPVSDITRARAKALVATLRKKNVTKSKKKEEPPKEKPPVKEPPPEEDPPKIKEPPAEEARLLSKETIRNVVAALRACLSEAVESNLIPANPAVRLGKFYKEAADYHEEIDTFSTEEVSLLLETIREHYGFENYALLLTLFHTGLRAGEAAGLYWSDLDVKNRTLLVRRQFSRGRKGKPKTRKKRAVDVSAVLLNELQTLKRQRQADYLAKGKNEVPESIFLSAGQIIWEDGKPVGHAEGGRVDMDTWRNRVFWKACDKAKIRRRRVHDTRHTFASLLLSNGEPLKYVSAQLGHSSIRMTADVYGHLEIGSNRAAMDRLPALLNPPQTQTANG